MAAGIPDILSAHYTVLRNDVIIPKKSLQELKNYKLPVSIDQPVTSLTTSNALMSVLVMRFWLFIRRLVYRLESTFVL